MSNFINTDEQLDVLVSLQELNRQLNRVCEDATAWKWVIVSLGSALNGALTCHLSGTMQVGALEMKVARKTIAALQHDGTEPVPSPFLAKPKDLLSRAMSDERIERTCDALAVTDRQKQSFGLVFKWRNQFLHFSPQGWSIEVSGLPEMIRDCIAILKKIEIDGWSFRRLKSVEREQLKDLFVEIEEKACQLQNKL
ncbi:hypothetical protein [Sulfitobacter geojensis]|uniref:hypothetical protein n=1 Tax=Sulfitobacter geojensis TaxID=1342299 RepID=UPI0007D95045|nr:hypothetical protein [Sulfitobacter geojensis]OAN90691.1 hypothetical protein A8B74_02590 [Sulfitobacter geojensis]